MSAHEALMMALLMVALIIGIQRLISRVLTEAES